MIKLKLELDTNNEGHMRAASAFFAALTPETEEPYVTPELKAKEDKIFEHTGETREERAIEARKVAEAKEKLESETEDTNEVTDEEKAKKAKERKAARAKERRAEKAALKEAKEEAEEAEEAEEGEISLDSLRTLVGELQDTHRKEIKAFFKEVGARNTSQVPVEKREDFYKLLKGLQ